MGELGIKIERPAVLLGRTHKIVTGCGNEYVIANRNPATSKLMEMFIILGKTGGCGAAQLEGIGRLVSRMLRNGFEAEVIIKDLRGIRCHIPNMVKGEEIMSCADAIGRILQTEIEWEKTLNFRGWWQSQTGNYPPTQCDETAKEGESDGRDKVDATGGGSSEEVRPGCEGSGKVEKLPNAGDAVEEIRRSTHEDVPVDPQSGNHSERRRKRKIRHE